MGERANQRRQEASSALSPTADCGAAGSHHVALSSDKQTAGCGCAGSPRRRQLGGAPRSMAGPSAGGGAGSGSIASSPAVWPSSSAESGPRRMASSSRSNASRVAALAQRLWHTRCSCVLPRACRDGYVRRTGGAQVAFRCGMQGDGSTEGWASAWQSHAAGMPRHPLHTHAAPQPLSPGPAAAGAPTPAAPRHPPAAAPPRQAPPPGQRPVQRRRRPSPPACRWAGTG